MLGRDVTSIMRLLPGVRYENTVDSLGMSFGTDVPNVGGARRDWSNVIVDGVVANEVGASSLMAQQINLDAIAEVRVLLNSYRAEYGRAGGGQVQIVSKSGTSNYHGNLYYYGRNEALNATDFFVNRANASSRATASTPTAPTSAARCRSWTRRCSSSTRWKRRSSAGPGRCATGRCRPIARCRGTSLRRSIVQGRLINIKDPLREGACNAVTGGPGCFPGNIIPANRINSNGRALLNMLPRANNFDRTFTQGQFNYSTQENADNPKMNNVVRVDWRPTCERQPVLHVQGLVLRPAWQRDHSRSEQVGVLQYALPEYGSRRERELRQDSPRQPRPRFRLRHPPADRAVLPVDRRRLGTDQPRQRRLHRGPVPPGAESAQRRSQSELQRRPTARTSRSTTGWSIKAKRG